MCYVRRDIMDFNDEKIDMVYLWCDGNEKGFNERKRKFLSIHNIDTNEEASGELRFFDNEELRYSLRSLEEYAPWINHVYIITDRQVPKWLNLKYEKVTVVDHSEIMPSEVIPCFNSAVIEYFLPFIPGLQEKFLYGNDDMFFGDSVYPSDFFNGNKPIVRVRKCKGRNLEVYKAKKDYSYYGTLVNSVELLKRFYKVDEEWYEMHHNIDAYSKSAFLDAYKKYEIELKKCFNHRFRNVDDIQRTLFSFDMVYSGRAEFKVVNYPKPWRRYLHFLKRVNWESYVDADNKEKTRRTILKFKPKFFCLNAGQNSCKESKIEGKKFMDSLFPKKSKFEV